MQWNDEGIVLGLRPHGESSAVVQLFTRGQGRHAGLVRGRKAMAALCQPGNLVQAVWTGRLPEQLGAYKLEPLHCAASLLLEDRGKLAALSSATALLLAALPEREPVPELYARMRAFAGGLADDPFWIAHYLVLELELLGSLGYGLELSTCAATGSGEDLAYVSPKSGHAVCRTAGAPYRDRLLKLPGFLAAAAQGVPVMEPPAVAEIIDGFRLTGYFLDTHAFTPHGGKLPAARGRLVQQFQGLHA